MLLPDPPTILLLLPRLSDGTAHRCPGHTATVCMSALRPSTTCIATLSHAHTVILVCIGLHLGGKSCGVTIATELPPLLPSEVLLRALAAGEGLTTRGKRGGSGGFPGKTAESQTCARCCCHCMLHTHSNSTHAWLATIMGVVPVTCAQPLACESMLAISLRSLLGFELFNF